MGLLKSVDNVPEIDKYDFRDSLYYNKYKYRARVHLEGIRVAWYCRSQLDFLKKIVEQHSQEYWMNDHSKKFRDQALANADEICNFLDFRDARIKDKLATVRIEGDIAGVFSNDLALLKTLKKLGANATVLDFTEVQATKFVGVKTFVRKPKHNYRIYLKSVRVEERVINELQELFLKRKDLHPSKACVRWLKFKGSKMYTWRGRYSSSSFFIEYDDESMLSYMALMYGELLGKRYKLEKRPDTI